MVGRLVGRSHQMLPTVSTRDQVSGIKTKNREILKEIAVFCPLKLVGARRVELLTFCTPSKRATRLRYAPKRSKTRYVM